MTTLFAYFGLLLMTSFDVSTSHSAHLGMWDYQVESPDITYKGVMELKEENDAYTGTIQSQGITIPLTDMAIDGDDITFKMSVQGFACSVSGTFDGDKLSGLVSVEGLSLPLTATRAQ